MEEKGFVTCWVKIEETCKEFENKTTEEIRKNYRININVEDERISEALIKKLYERIYVNFTTVLKKNIYQLKKK